MGRQIVCWFVVNPPESKEAIVNEEYALALAREVCGKCGLTPLRVTGRTYFEDTGFPINVFVECETSPLYDFNVSSGVEMEVEEVNLSVNGWVTVKAMEIVVE